jgi:o-succinylbenzoate---CoA ligase
MNKGPIGWRDTTPVLLLNPRLPDSDKNLYEKAWQSEIERRTSERLSLDVLGLATSGTSGSLKLVLLSRAAFLASAQGVNEHLDSSPSDIWLKTLPEFHVGGLSIFARAFISGAGVHDVTITGDRKWDANHFKEQLVASRATLTAIVPAQVFSLVQEKIQAPEKLRAAIVGSAALSPHLYFEGRNLGWPLLPSYGLTECCSQVATVALESLRRVPTEVPRPRLLSHIEARVSAEGFVEIKSKALLEGYLKISASGLTTYVDPKREGWLKTEDKVDLVDDEIIVHGRSSDFVKIGGESVDFERLNQKLEELRSKRTDLPDLALIPFPDDRLGHLVLLVCDASMQPSGVRELVNTYNTQVLPFERIRDIRYVPIIPRSSLGKLLRADLIKMLNEKITPFSVR